MLRHFCIGGIGFSVCNAFLMRRRGAENDAYFSVWLRRLHRKNIRFKLLASMRTSGSEITL